MKKILFIATRDPYSGRYSGDVIGSNKIINVLKKKKYFRCGMLRKKNHFAKKRF